MRRTCRTRAPPSPPIRDLKEPTWNGWGDLSNTRFMNPKDADLTAGKVSRLKLKWAFGFPGATAMYWQTIYAGRVFVSSNAGYVYSLDTQTGCIYWSYHSPAVVRSGITIGPLKPDLIGSLHFSATYAGTHTHSMPRQEN